MFIYPPINKRNQIKKAKIASPTHLFARYTIVN